MTRTPARATQADERAAIDDDTPLRLELAARLYFHPNSGVTAASLRTEARKGRLAIARIAGKDFTTLRALKEMSKPCVQGEPDSGYDQPMAAKSSNGSSRTGEPSIALASAMNSLQKLKQGSRNTSRTGTTRGAVVGLPGRSKSLT